MGRPRRYTDKAIAVMRVEVGLSALVGARVVFREPIIIREPDPPGHEPEMRGRFELWGVYLAVNGREGALLGEGETRGEAMAAARASHMWPSEADYSMSVRDDGESPRK
jgi:hypothetical protein